MADTIERYLNEHNDGRYELFFFREDKPMGSGGSLSLIRDKIHEPFFLTNCDNILQQDLAEIVEVHRQKKNEMTVGDNPPVGILLCTDKGSRMVEYALSGMDNQLFVSTYMLHLSDKRKLQEFMLK
jgi:NDP-sugar pyrophosphorylase family protein